MRTARSCADVRATTARDYATPRMPWPHPLRASGKWPLGPEPAATRDKSVSSVATRWVAADRPEGQPHAAKVPVLRPAGARAQASAPRLAALGRCGDLTGGNGGARLGRRWIRVHLRPLEQLLSILRQLVCVCRPQNQYPTYTMSITRPGARTTVRGTVAAWWVSVYSSISKLCCTSRSMSAGYLQWAHPSGRRGPRSRCHRESWG